MKKQIMLERINRKEVLRYLGYKGISADATVNMSVRQRLSKQLFQDILIELQE